MSPRYIIQAAGNWNGLHVPGKSCMIQNVDMSVSSCVYYAGCGLENCGIVGHAHEGHTMQGIQVSLDWF